MDEAAGAASSPIELGRALQLTNILRDLDEDAAIGRLYLPREALTDAGIATTRSARRCSPIRALDARLPPLVAARALEHFAAADRDHARRGRAARLLAPRLMARGLSPHPRAHDRAQGWAPPRRRVQHRPAPRLLWIAARRQHLLMPRARRVHVVGAGLAGLVGGRAPRRGAAPVVAARGGAPGRRALPLLPRAGART